jgi:hypothetical protein
LPNATRQMPPQCCTVPWVSEIQISHPIKKTRLALPTLCSCDIQLH